MFLCGVGGLRGCEVTYGEFGVVVKDAHDEGVVAPWDWRQHEGKDGGFKTVFGDGFLGSEVADPPCPRNTGEGEEICETCGDGGGAVLEAGEDGVDLREKFWAWACGGEAAERWKLGERV